jgi:CheY-like chemotaxis protein/HPt (histidine-containing phosphotransfer) domain-containing protein
MDGVQAATRLTESGDAPKVILVTAYDSEEVALQAEEAGITAVLHKPVSPSTLHDAVVHALTPDARFLPRQGQRILTRRFAAGQHVLLVEDHPVNRELARELLRQAGLTVTEAENGIEALQQLDARRFDAVLMDVQMPGMDGIEAVHAIRARPELKELPVIAMTAHAMLGDRERFLEDGMSDYVAKPIEEDELLRALGSWLRVESESPAVEEEPQRPAGLPASLPGLDLAAGLRRAGGNAELYRRMLISLLGELAGVVPRLRDLLDRGETTQALSLLHTLKGTSGTIGAVWVAEAATSLEAALKKSREGRHSLDELSGAVDEIQRGSEVLRTAEADEKPRDDGAGIDRETAQAALPIAARLAEHVASNNLAATTAFAELRTALSGRTPSSLRELERCLDQLDFDAAGPHIARVSSELARAAGADA